MSDPKWALVAQLGDADPVDHGGFFVFVDTTGKYDPQCVCLPLGELLDGLCSDDPIARAIAFQALEGYHGANNFDTDPLRLNRAEAEARYLAHEALKP